MSNYNPPWNKGKKMEYAHGMSGRKHTLESKEKMRRNRLKKIPWNKGITFMQGEDHPQWKGDGVGYTALHSWINRRLGKAVHCTFAQSIGSTCNTTYEWANISHEYRRDLSDWMPLCQKCHLGFDKGFLSARKYFQKRDKDHHGQRIIH